MDLTLFHEKTGQTLFHALFCLNQKDSLRGGQSFHDVIGRTFDYELTK